MEITKKIYCYAVCFVCFVSIILGLVDISSAAMSYCLNKPEAQILQMRQGSDTPAQGSLDLLADEYYQKKIFADRIYDGTARIFLPGLIFIYFSRKIKKTEV